MDDTLNATLQRMQEERRAAIRTFLSTAAETKSSVALKALHELMPSPERLRELAAYVDVEKLREIEDPAEIAANFQEVRLMLLSWAALMEMTRD